jgi:hypothetical protein
VTTFDTVLLMSVEQPAEPVRHVDDGVPLARFTERILVVCPRCGGQAVVVPRPGVERFRYYGELVFTPRRLACGGCGAVGEWEAEKRGNALVAAVLGGTEEPFFRRPLWLQTRCVGKILWAYNEEHVDALRDFVRADVRERGPVSPTRAMFPRLPAWMKKPGNRADVLAGLEALRELVRLRAPGDRSDAAHERGDRPRPWSSTY